MGFFNKGKDRKLSTALNGGVDGGSGTDFHKQREIDIIEAVFGTRSSDLDQNVLAIDNPRTIGKRGGRTVSLDTLAGDTLDQQRLLDKQIVEENMGHGAEAPKTGGKAPCQLVQEEKAGKTGWFGKRNKEG
jgi:hypothetical protein